MKCPRVILVALMCATVNAHSQRAADASVLYFDDTPGGARNAADLGAALARKMPSGGRVPRIDLIAVDLANKQILRDVLARELRKPPAAIVAANSNVAMVAQTLTRDIPIIFASHEDPVKMGFAQSLAHPGGNLTGFTYFAPIDAKRLELLREIAPHARRLGIVTDRWWLDESGGSAVVRTARDSLGFAAEIFQAESPSELKKLLSTRRAKAIDAWYVPLTWLPYQQPEVVVKQIAAMRRPAIYAATRFVDAGGLVSYGQQLSRDEALTLLATALALALDGVPTQEIPIERPKAFELAVNVSAARALGISIPAALLKRADRVVAQ